MGKGSEKEFENRTRKTKITDQEKKLNTPRTSMFYHSRLRRGKNVTCSMFLSYKYKKWVTDLKSHGHGYPVNLLHIS